MIKKFPPAADLIKVAKRTVWFQRPEEVLLNPLFFIAHVLTFGTFQDIKTLLSYLTEEELQEAVENAPPGIFDGPSWAYWNLKIGRYPAPPMPVRRF